jgi:hypothetical protein
VDITYADKLEHKLALRNALFDLIRHETPDQPAGIGGPMLRYWLRRRNVSKFDPYAQPPKTKALDKIKAASVPHEQQRIEEAFGTTLARGYGTLKDIEDAVFPPGHRQFGSVTPQQWAKHLRNACTARGFVLIGPKRPTHGGPRYFFWGVGSAAVMAAVRELVKMIRIVSAGAPATRQFSQSATARPNEDLR